MNAAPIETDDMLGVQEHWDAHGAKVTVGARVHKFTKPDRVGTVIRVGGMQCKVQWDSGDSTGPLCCRVVVDTETEGMEK